METAKADKLIIKFGRLLHEQGYIAGYDGNLSLRLNSSRILITPSMKAKGFLRAGENIVIDYSGKEISGGGRPSSETAMHLQVYANRPDISACCHAHPPHATAFAAAGKKLPADILPEAILLLGEIPLVEYIPTGVAEKWAAFAKYARKGFAYLLKNHGVLTTGRTLEEAYFRMETVEHYARIVYIAQKLGRPKALGKAETARLIRIHKKMFGES